MEIIQFDLSGRGAPDIAETVYESLQGLLVPGCALPWVENIFIPGHPCHDAYERMLAAYDRLLARFGETDEDNDTEIMIGSLLQYSRILALEMFRYGQEYQKMLDNEQN